MSLADQEAHFLSQALQQEQAGDANAALDTFDQAIAEGVATVLIHSNRGLLLDRLGKHQQALAAFRSAYVLEPNFRDHYNAGNMLIQLERFEDALSEFQASLSYRADYPECWTNKGVAHHALGDESAARAAFDKALQLDPDFAAAHRCLAILHGNAGREQLSLGHFQKAAQVQPNNASAWFEYACARYKALGEGSVSFDPQGDEGKTVAALDKAISLDPDLPGAWGRKIGVLFRLADAAQASDAAARSADQEVPNMLPLILADLGSTLQEAQERFPGDPWFQERFKDLQSFQNQ